MMKITLFIKSFIIKVVFCLVIITYIVFHPSYTQASFFSNLFAKVLGNETQAAEISSIDDTIKVHNSQTLPLQESSVNPDLNSIKKDIPTIAIISNEALVSNNSPLGIDNNIEEYASDEKINVYIVEKGDTLDSIAKKLKILKSTIIASNADLKKSDLLKIGQQLVILAFKDQPKKKNEVISSKEYKIKKNEVPVKKIDPLPIVQDKVKEIEPVIANIALPSLSTPVVVESTIEAPKVNEQQTVKQTTIQSQFDNTINTPSGQPIGTINGGYIWPLSEGIGRVSQGLHADNAYDFSAPKGTPIFAIQSGTVLIAHPSGWNGGYGKYIVIDFDDGRQAIFGHMNKVSVNVGQKVKQGDVIGYVGSTGHSTGPHVHIGFHGSLGNPYLGLKVNAKDLQIND